MPVTAKLSRGFYDAFGDDIANELVEWFNKVDATYRADLRELNELNFARFDAKLEQRLAQFETWLERRIAQSEAKVDRRFVELEAKVDHGLMDLEAKVDQGFVEIRADMDRRFAESAAGFESRLAKLEKTIADNRADTIRWLFLFWAGTIVPLGGLLVALAG